MSEGESLVSSGSHLDAVIYLGPDQWQEHLQASTTNQQLNLCKWPRINRVRIASFNHRSVMCGFECSPSQNTLWSGTLLNVIFRIQNPASDRWRNHLLIQFCLQLNRLESSLLSRDHFLTTVILIFPYVSLGLPRI